MRPRRRTHWESEERTQLWITIGFLVLIAAALLILGGAAAISYYNQHLKPLASVAGAQINRDQLVERAKLEVFRARREEGLVRRAIAADEIDETLAQDQLAAVQQREVDARPSVLVEKVIDEKFKAKLAGDQGIGVSDDEVQAAVAKESSFPEKRRVYAVIVEPRRPDAGGEPEQAQKDEARKKAEAALADLTAGRRIEEVAAKYSTHFSRDRGGLIGAVTDETLIDERWREELFKLPEGGTTGIVEGLDGAYRIGRVTQIVPAQDDPTYLQDLQREVSLESFREALRAELISEKLERTVIEQASTGQLEQVRAARIVLPVLSQESAGVAHRGSVKVSHILYAPNDDSQAASTLKKEDPAWAEAKKEADAAAKALRAIADVSAREKALAERAKKESDDPGSGRKGGELGWAAGNAFVPGFSAAVFEGEHKRGDIIGPVQTEFGWHVILFHAKRAESDEFVNELMKQLRNGGDFAALAKEHSGAVEAPQGGDLGWIARLQRPKPVEDVLFALQPGQVSDPVKLPSEIRQDGEDLNIFKVFERATRAIDADQRNELERNGFSNWYTPKKDAAKASGEIWQDEQALAEPQPGEEQQPVFPGGDQLPGGELPGDELPPGLPPGDEGEP